MDDFDLSVVDGAPPDWFLAGFEDPLAVPGAGAAALPPPLEPVPGLRADAGMGEAPPTVDLTQRKVLGVDPGVKASAWVVVDADTKKPIDYGFLTHDVAGQRLGRAQRATLYGTNTERIDIITRQFMLVLRAHTPETVCIEQQMARSGMCTLVQGILAGAAAAVNAVVVCPTPQQVHAHHKLPQGVGHAQNKRNAVRYANARLRALNAPAFQDPREGKEEPHHFADAFLQALTVLELQEAEAAAAAARPPLPTAAE